MTERWTDERLDQLAEIVDGNARSIQAFGNEIAEYKRISQAERQALSRDIAQLVTTQEQNSRELNEAMIRLTNTQEGIARLLSSLDEDRPTILRQLNTIEGKVDSLLQRHSDNES